MAQKDVKFWIVKIGLFLPSFDDKKFPFWHFLDYMKGLSALFSLGVACYEPMRFTPRFIAYIRTPQATHFIPAIKRCHYETQIIIDFTASHNRKRSKTWFVAKRISSINRKLFRYTFCNSLYTIN